MTVSGSRSVAMVIRAMGWEPFAGVPVAALRGQALLIQTAWMHAISLAMALQVGIKSSIMRFSVTMITMVNFWRVVPERGSGRMNHPSRCVNVDAMMMDQRAPENRCAHTDGYSLPAMLLL